MLFFRLEKSSVKIIINTKPAETEKTKTPNNAQSKLQLRDDNEFFEKVAGNFSDHFLELIFSKAPETNKGSLIPQRRKNFQRTISNPDVMVID